MTESSGTVFTVSQINGYVKMLVDSDMNLSDVSVRGEISNFTNHYRTGHLYFTLKDGESLIKAVMFRSSAAGLKFIPENGMKVVVRGRVSVFVRDGVYQLYAERMEPDGVGTLYAAFEALRRKLESEGLFDQERKRKIPEFPRTVGVITSPTGAAVRDILNILGRRYPAAKVEICPAAVQGVNAPSELISALRTMNSRSCADVLIIGRGGGSIEDLWAFNDESLAREVAASRIPVISAVGHETDFTICDFAADLRAPTPSAAAELAVPDASELRDRINAAASRISGIMTGTAGAQREKLRMLAGSRVLSSPEWITDDRRMSVLSLSVEMEKALAQSYSSLRTSLGAISGKLEALSPLSVLSRGFSAVYGEGKKIRKRAAELNEGENVEMVFSDGSASARITGINVCPEVSDDREK